MSELPAPAATAARAIGAALLRHAITVAGSALVAHGYVDQDTVNGAVSPIADYLVGAAMIVGAAGWSAMRARLAHGRWATAWRALRDQSPA